MSKPVFHDASGARKRWSIGLVAALLALVLLAAAAFAATILSVPAGPPLGIAFERSQPASISEQLTQLRHRLNRGLRSIGWLPKKVQKHPPGKPLTVAFYVPWDPDSASALQRHAGEIDWVVPARWFVNGSAHALTQMPDRRFDTVMATATHRPLVLPMVQNASNGVWDTAGADALFRTPAARAHLVASLLQGAIDSHAGGVVLDFEELSPATVPLYIGFVRQLRQAFAAKHLLVTVTAPVGDRAWNLRALGQAADRVFLMDYDEHSVAGEPGPIASQGWFLTQLRAAAAQIPPAKLIVAMGNYGYDWHGNTVDPATVEEAWQAAKDSGATVTFDKTSANATFAYDEAGERHEVWILDAASMWNQLLATRAMGVNAVALWRLGSEDPGAWTSLAAWRSGQRPDLSTVRSVANVDIEGAGEILRITDLPRAGQRALAFDADGLIRDESFSALPSPLVVQRAGYRPKMVALTFDDGPDGTWTPRILDVLAQKHVPGTFFVIGENALAHPFLLRRIVDQGSEIGNHSYTHPNLALVSPRGVALELNTTQRLIQAYTGRSTHLFRAPYFGDAEPSTADELAPAWEGQERGYTEVGLHVDPDDWKRPGVDAIVERTIDKVTGGPAVCNDDSDANCSRNIVLLHDAGGDRSETVAALPRIIDGLRARGYTLVPVSTLVGLTRDQVMPPVTGSDLVAVRIDVGVFAVLALIAWLLKWLFAVAITLGIARAVLMAGLAVATARRDRDQEEPAFAPDRLVSVIIPAWNEERVIVASVARVLASEQANIEVIVADDGSTDRTSALVQEAYADDPRVTLLTLVNGGKASALNRALTQAKGEVIVALDADTQFEALTVARLARWFVDPAIGAVAGNAKVGNRVNIVTRWQAVEYVTAQNVERRALARFDAMMVVPGAVGAWRRAALDAVGGYPEDTLAEDQDLTIAVQRAGWEVAYDVDAVAWTEAPERLKSLAKQRYRWAFGTLQCLWKHRRILRTREPRGLALVGFPQAWLFQILFAAVSPVIDLALVVSTISTVIRVQQHGWAQTQSDVLTMGAYWLIFTAIDVICGWIAYRLEPRERRYPAHLLVAQRIVYRQLMYWVVLRAIASAIAGLGVGWGQQQRSGNVAATAVPGSA